MVLTWEQLDISYKRGDIKKDIIDEDKNRILTWAADNGHLDIVKYLVERGVSIGDDVVYLAAQEGHLENYWSVY